MSAFDNKYNYDDTIIRDSIASLLNEINNKIVIKNQISNESSKLIRIPFLYAMSGDERALQDAFSNWDDCIPDFIDGNHDPIPRGELQLTGVSIMSANLTSRYVRGYYNKEENGEMKRFNSYINSIPLQLNFSANILADTSIDTFKIVQSIISTFYRTISFSVAHNGFRIPTQVGFPDNFQINKQ